MTLDPRAIAVQGIGFAPMVMGLQGFAPLELPAVQQLPSFGGSSNRHREVLRKKKKRRQEEEEFLLALMR